MKYNVTNCGSDYLFDPFFDLFVPRFHTEPRDRRFLDMRTDVKEEENRYVLEVELPGIDKKNISLSFKDGYLTLEAKTESSEKEAGKDCYLHRERWEGSAQRTYYLGEIDEKAINASFKNGVLFIDVPKKEKVVEENHQIEIH